MSKLTRTGEEVEAMVHEIASARSRARDACRLYAEEVTGWTPGTRLRDRRGDVYEVLRFAGVHPQTWGVEPYVVALRVKANGETGKREARLGIDFDGYWRRKWIPVEEGSDAGA